MGSLNCIFVKAVGRDGNRST